VVRIDASQVRTVEKTDYTYEFSQITRTDKQIITDLTGDISLNPTTTNLSLPVNFRIYESGGQVTQEEAHFKYQGNHLLESKIYTTKPLGNTTAEKNTFEYDSQDRISRNVNILFEGVPQTQFDVANFDFNTQLYPRTTTVRDQYQYITTGLSAGLAAGYQETINTSLSPKKVTVRNVGSIEYDAQRRLNSSITSEQDFLITNNGLSAVTETRTLIIQAGADKLPGYDAFGRLQNLVRVTLDRGLVTTETIHHTFSQTDGRVNASRVFNHQEDRISQGQLLKRDWQEDVTYVQFDPHLNRIMTQTREITEGNRRTIENTKNTYDTQGHTSIVSSDRSEMAVDNDGNILAGVLNKKTSTVTKSSNFDDLGFMTQYVRTTKENDKQTTETVSNLTYDGYGQVLASHTKTEEKDLSKDGKKLNSGSTTDLTQTFDALGRVINYTKTTILNNETQRTLETAALLTYDTQNHLLYQESNFEEQDILDPLHPGAHYHKTNSVVMNYTQYNTWPSRRVETHHLRKQQTNPRNHHRSHLRRPRPSGLYPNQHRRNFDFKSIGT
jgi:hypothetical protein